MARVTSVFVKQWSYPWEAFSPTPTASEALFSWTLRSQQVPSVAAASQCSPNMGSSREGQSVLWAELEAVTLAIEGALSDQTSRIFTDLGLLQMASAGKQPVL